MGASNGDATYPANALGSASGDAPGGSLVGFSYHWGESPFTSVPQDTVTGIYTSFQVQPPAGGTAYTTFQIRNPRYLSVYAPPTPPASGPSFSVLYADDNGAFDLTPTAAGFLAYANNLQFTQAQYQSMTLPVGGISGNLVGTTPSTYNRTGLPFVPSCVQRLNADGTNPKYLITQTNSQPELGSNPNSLGGEVFEIDMAAGATIATTTASGGFNGATLSRPGLTGPLTQPTSAIRPQQ